jgi:hypothetical protein
VRGPGSLTTPCCWSRPLLELPLDSAKRGIDGIYKVVAVFFAVSILPGSERVTRTASVPC